MSKKILAITSVLFIAGLLFAQAQTASADILRGNNSSASALSVSVSTISFSHTLGSASNFLALGVYESIGGGPPIPITSVTYGSQMMILATTAASNTSIYYLVNPTPGTNTITITLSGAANEYAVVASDYSGVDTLNPIDVSTSQIGDTTPLTLTVTTTKDKDWAFLYMRDGTGTSVAGTNSTSIIILPIFGNVAFDNQGHGNITPAGSWSMTVTNNGTLSMHGSMITFSPASNPVPITTSILPTSVVAGSSGFTLTVNGTNFISSSVVQFNGSDRSTTFVNSTQLTAQILISDLVTAGTFPITVFNPSPGGGTSNPQNFTVTPIAEGNLWQIRSFQGKGFITTTNEITVTPSTETDFVLIKNPTTSDKLHMSNQLTVTVRTEGQNVRLRIYKNPTVTANGTPVAVNKIRTTGNTPVSQAFSMPTIPLGGRGTLIAAYSRNADSLDRPFDLSLYLEPGESYLVTVQGTATGNDYMLTYTFVEE